MNQIQSTFSQISILVADDDPIIQDAVEIVLRGYGYRIVGCDSAETAWTTVQTEAIDLVLLDLHLPGASGFDFISGCRMSKTLGGLPIIVMTADTEPEACQKAFDLGATSYIQKPLQWPLVAHTVWYVLRNEARETEFRKLRDTLGLETRAPMPTV